MRLKTAREQLKTYAFSNSDMSKSIDEFLTKLEMYKVDGGEMSDDDVWDIIERAIKEYGTHKGIKPVHDSKVTHDSELNN